MVLADPPTCRGSNHVPGCEHFAELRSGPPEAFLGVDIAREGLDMSIDVGITRRGRRRCPRCGRKRQLFSLSAFASDQPVGYGVARCLSCAGLRPGR